MVFKDHPRADPIHALATKGVADAISPTIKMPPGVIPPWVEEFLRTVTAFDIILWGAVAFVVLKWGRKWWRGLVATATRFLVVAKTIESISALTDFMADTTETLANQTQTLEEQNERIAGIYHETHKNDGSSIKDSGLRTEEAVDRLERGVLAVFVRLDAAGIRGDDNEVRIELEDTHPRAIPFIQKE